MDVIFSTIINIQYTTDKYVIYSQLKIELSVVLIIYTKAEGYWKLSQQANLEGNWAEFIETISKSDENQPAF